MKIYSALPVKKSAQYEEVQWAILKAYELVNEEYHQKFRNCKKQYSQTYVEFAREMKHFSITGVLLSRYIDNDYNQLKQLILVEEFKKWLQSDV